MAHFAQEIRTKIRFNHEETTSIRAHSSGTLDALARTALSDATQECKAINTDSDPQCALRTEQKCSAGGYGLDFTCSADICVNPIAPAKAASQVIARATEIHEGFQVFQRI